MEDAWLAEPVEGALEPRITTVTWSAPSWTLTETVQLVEKLDWRCIAVKADVRNAAQVRSVVQTAVENFGEVDILAANAGIAPIANWDNEDESLWHDTLDVNVKGVWLACREVAKHMIERGGGGSIIVTSPVAGIQALYTLHNYSVAKHGVIGIMRTLSAELAPHWIRVNVVVPGVVETPMMVNDPNQNLFSGRESGGTVEEMKRATETLNLFPTRGCSRSTSPTPSCGWGPTRRGTSPVSPCRSTADSPTSPQGSHSQPWHRPPQPAAELSASRNLPQGG